MHPAIGIQVKTLVACGDSQKAWFDVFNVRLLVGLDKVLRRAGKKGLALWN